MVVSRRRTHSTPLIFEQNSAAQRIGEKGAVEGAVAEVIAFCLSYFHFAGVTPLVRPGVGTKAAHGFSGGAAFAGLLNVGFWLLFHGRS